MSFTGVGLIFAQGYDAGSLGTAEEVGQAIIDLFEKKKFVRKGTAETVKADREFTWLTEEMCPRHKKLPGTHFFLNEECFTDKVVALSLTMSEDENFGEIFDDVEEEEDEIKIPCLDISILDVTKPLDHDDGTDETNLLIEFTYDETRGDIGLRDRLPIYTALKKLLGCKKIVKTHATIEPVGMRGAEAVKRRESL